MTLHYLDCDPLMHWAEWQGPPFQNRTERIAKEIDELIRSGADTTGCSEHTLLEWHNGICKHWRDTAAEHQQHDQAWAQRVTESLMQLITDGRLIVLPTPPKIVEKAMMLVTLATRDHGRNFRIHDALHLVCAAAWAASTQERVRLATTDGDFFSFVELYPEFSELVELWDPSL